MAPGKTDEPVENIRVVLIDMPRLLRDIVSQLAGPGLRIVRAYDAPVELVGAVDRDRADVVITGAEAHEQHELDRLLAERPRVKVLGIAADGRSSSLYELVPRRRSLGELSSGRLNDAVRRAVERDRGWRRAAS
jgi:hypothetical protein